MTTTEDYEWLSGHKHVLLRPDTYVGPVSVTEIKGHTFELNNDKYKCTTVSCNASPALFKLLDEVIVNCMDNSKRDKSQRCIKAYINQQTGRFMVFNDGDTIPIEFWEGTERYVPEILVYELMSGQNFKESL